MPISPETILDAFKQKGLRITTPRRTLALLLSDTIGTDFTVEELWDMALKREPAVGRARVFRAVEILLKLQRLDRFEFPDGRHRFGFCPLPGHHHHHFTSAGSAKWPKVRAC